MRPRFLADENIDQDLVFGLRRRVDDADIVRVQDVGLRTVDDPQILQWAADASQPVPLEDLLGTDEGADIEFEPDRLGSTARTAEL